MMELSHLLLALLALIPVVYICLYKHIMRKESHNAAGKGKFPPGTSGWPLVGETLDYFAKVQEGALYKFLTERMKKYSSTTFRTSLIGETMVLFCNAEANKFLFSNENKLVQVWFPSTMKKIFPKSDYSKSSAEHSHTLSHQLRLFFKTDMLREHVGFMDTVMKKHLQTHWNCKQVKIDDMAKKYLFTLSCNIFLGINDPGQIDKFTKGMENIETGIYSIPVNLPGTALNRAVKASNRLLKELEPIIRQRRANLLKLSLPSGKDLMSHMFLATNDGKCFSDQDIAGHLVGLLLGGYTTLHSTIIGIMNYLAEHPDVYDSVLKEQKEILVGKEPSDLLISWEDLRKVKYSWNVACEVLRVLSPGRGSFREAITDFTYEGYAIPRGSKIHWIADATHKNPKYFLEPEKFDPTRFQGDGPTPYAFVPFGGGPRMCPGNEYARLVILVFMHNVVSQFRWEKLIPDEKTVYYPAPRPAHGLPVLLHPHRP